LKSFLASLSTIILFTLCFGSCFCQPNIKEANLPYGSAGNCLGKSLLVNCFITEVGSNWSDQEKEIILEKEKEGIEWLINQAIIWGKPELSFKIINFTKEHDILLASIPKINWINVGTTKYVLHAAGYEDIFPLYDSLKKKYDVDNVLFLFFSTTEGRSFAQPVTKKIVNFDRENYIEGAIVYKTYRDNEKVLRNGTIIHEILHLYGAWDLYNPKKEWQIDNTIYAHYARSIMLNGRKNDLSNVIIDPLTAWRIGWSKNYFDWFEIFRKKGR